MKMNFVGTGKRLADIDLPELGAQIGVGEDEVHAFLDVETNGHGFDGQGRPKMLFEPHKFYAYLSGAAREKAIQYGVAYPDQGQRPYPADSYPHLTVAMGINAEAALKSASWGIGQVLGSNCIAAGFHDVTAFVSAMLEGEREQLLAAINFIKHNRLDDELREHNFAAFARGYNGPNYRVNAYDSKLKKAYEKWRKIRNTPYPRPQSETLSAALHATPDHPVVFVDGPAFDIPGHGTTATQVIALKPPPSAKSSPTALPISEEAQRAAAEILEKYGTKLPPPGHQAAPVAKKGGFLNWVSSLFRMRNIEVG